MAEDIVGQWVLDRITFRDGELQSSGEPWWHRAPRTVEGPTVPACTLELTEDGRFVERDEEPFKDEAVRDLQIVAVLQPRGAGTREAFWRAAPDEVFDAWVVARADAASNHRQLDEPTLTDTLRVDGDILIRQVEALTDGVYLNECVLHYGRASAPESAVEDAATWLQEQRDALSQTTRTDELPALQAAHPRLGARAATLLSEEATDDELSAVLALRGEVDRLLFLKGHKKRSDTWAWASRLAEQLDALLAASGRVFLSPKLTRLPFDAPHALRLLAHGHLEEVQAWADKALAKKAKRPARDAILVRSTADLLQGRYGTVVQRISALKKAQSRADLVWLCWIAKALDGDVDGALTDRVSQAADRNRPHLETLSFEHAMRLVDEAAQAVRTHTEAVLTERGDPHLAPLLFLHARNAGSYLDLSVRNDGQLSMPAEQVFAGERPEPYVVWALRLLHAHFKRQGSLTTGGRKVLTQLIGDRA